MMTKRKIGIFCLMAGLVFAVSRGSQVRHASAAADVTLPQNTPVSLQPRMAPSTPLSAPVR
jgi:hypothetical protein